MVSKAESFLPSRETHGFCFGGEQFLVVDAAALWWERERALIVADMHLEKGSWFAERGQLLPPYDSAETIKKLSQLVDSFGAQSVYCLGDNFHDDAGVSRLSEECSRQLDILSKRTKIHWIIGNHDSGIDAPTDGEVHRQLKIRELALRHIAEKDSTLLELSGHYHPKARVRINGRVLSRPCFALDDQKLILPAFGAYAGGLDICDDVMVNLFPQGVTAMIRTKSRLCNFPYAVTAGWQMPVGTVA